MAIEIPEDDKLLIIAEQLSAIRMLRRSLRDIKDSVLLENYPKSAATVELILEDTSIYEPD